MRRSTDRKLISSLILALMSDKRLPACDLMLLKKLAWNILNQCMLVYRSLNQFRELWIGFYWIVVIRINPAQR